MIISFKRSELADHHLLKVLTNFNLIKNISYQNNRINLGLMAMQVKEVKNRTTAAQRKQTKRTTRLPFYFENKFERNEFEDLFD